MRSKEVEKAIKVIQRDFKEYKEELDFAIKFEDGIDEQSIAYLEQQTSSYETLLSYIETLEQLPNKIRDKIKKLEEDKQTILQAIEEAKESKDEEFLKYNREILYRINGEISILKELLEE